MISSNIRAQGTFPMAHHYADGRIAAVWSNEKGFLCAVILRRKIGAASL